MSGGPSQTQLNTVEIFRKKIAYYEYILKTHFELQYLKNPRSLNQLFYICKNCKASDFLPDNELKNEDSLIRYPCLSLKTWWNREDILINKTDMNDYEFLKFVKSSWTGCLLDLSDFQPFHVISSEKEAIDYKPFEISPSANEDSECLSKKIHFLEHKTSGPEPEQRMKRFVPNLPCGGGGGGGGSKSFGQSCCS